MYILQGLRMGAGLRWRLCFGWGRERSWNCCIRYRQLKVKGTPRVSSEIISLAGVRYSITFIKIEKQRLHWLGLLVYTTYTLVYICGTGRSTTGDIARPKVWNARISHPNFAWTVTFGPNLVDFVWNFNFPEFRTKSTSLGDRGQRLLEKFSRRSWIRRVVILCSLTYTLRSTKLTTASWTLRPVICSGRRSCFCKDTFGGGCLVKWDPSSLSSLNGLKQSFERIWREITRQHKQPFTP